ncbi:MAG: elongation factor P [Phycisphaerae bacterium]|nr:elongation factor P [Phycisphaerae bacterium]
MIRATEIRKGRTILHEGELYVVHDSQHVAKGNWRSYMQIRMKSIKSGQILDVRYRVDDPVETPFLESKEMEYLYEEGDKLILMDTETYDQIPLEKDVIGDGIKFLKPNERLACQIYEEKVISAELPNVVDLEVTDTPPAIKGATATNQNKDALLETGARVKVPPFIEIGERVRVDTRSGEYVERAK